MSNGNCIGYHVKMSGFRTRLGHCVVVLRQSTFLSQCLSPVGSKNGYRRIVRGYLEMD